MAKQWVILCGDCGTPVIATHNRTRFCAECAKKRDKLSIERSKERRRLSKIEGDEEDPLHFCDSPERIAMCLNCTKKECTNCHATPSNGNAKIEYKPCGAHYVDIKHELVECFLAGMLGKEIAIKFNVHPKTVGNWKIKLKKEGLL